MSRFITYKQCPICGSDEIEEVIKVKDYTVSKEVFSIWHCNICRCRFTQNAPDAKNIGAYYQSADYISHSDTKKGLVNALYHIIRNFTIRSKKRLIEKAVNRRRGSLLDIGAGTGSFAAIIKRAGWEVTGLEPDDIARENALKNNALQLHTMETLFSFREEKFDVITMWHVLEHVHQLHDYIITFKKILKKGGILVIAVPNFTSLDAIVYKEFWAGYDVPRHLYHFSPNSVQVLMLQHGFKVIQYEPMWFDSFYVSMLSEQYRNGHNNFIKATWSGLVSNIKAMGDVKKCSSITYIIRKEI